MKRLVISLIASAIVTFTGLEIYRIGYQQGQMRCYDDVHQQMVVLEPRIISAECIANVWSAMQGPHSHGSLDLSIERGCCGDGGKTIIRQKPDGGNFHSHLPDGGVSDDLLPQVHIQTDLQKEPDDRPR